MPEDAIHKPTTTIRWDGDVFNYVSLAMKLTWSKLLKDKDWNVWKQSKYTQIDQYDARVNF